MQAKRRGEGGKRGVLWHLVARMLTPNWQHFPSECSRLHKRTFSSHKATIIDTLHAKHCNCNKSIRMCTTIISQMHICKCLSKYQSVAMPNIFRFFSSHSPCWPLLLSPMAVVATALHTQFLFYRCLYFCIWQNHFTNAHDRSILLIYSIAANCIERYIRLVAIHLHAMPRHECQNNVCLGFNVLPSNV